MPFLADNETALDAHVKDLFTQSSRKLQRMLTPYGMRPPVASLSAVNASACVLAKVFSEMRDDMVVISSMQMATFQFDPCCRQNEQS